MALILTESGRQRGVEKDREREREGRAFGRRGPLEAKANRHAKWSEKHMNLCYLAKFGRNKFL